LTIPLNIPLLPGDILHIFKHGLLVSLTSDISFSTRMNSMLQWCIINL